ITQGDATLTWLQVRNATAALQVGGQLALDGLWVSSSYTLPAEVTELKNLYLDRLGARLTSSHTLTVTDDLTLIGALAGTGRTIQAAGATGSIGSSDQFSAYNGVLYDTHVLEIGGSMTFGGTNAKLQGNDLSTVEIAATGVVDLNTSGSGFDGNNETAKLVNHGTILVTAAGDHRITHEVENYGTIAVSAGATALASATSKPFTNGGTITGQGVFFTDRFVNGSDPFTHQAGAVLDVKTLRIGSTLDGTSTVITGPLAVANLEIQNGLVTLAQNVTFERLMVHYAASTTLAATYSNSGTTTVTDVLQMGKATLAGSGTTILAAAGLLDLAIVHNRSIADTHTLINNGTATWGPMASTSMTIAPDAVLENRGTFVVQNDRPMSGGGLLRNFGVLRKEAAAGVSAWAVCYRQETGGSVDEVSGSIEFTGACPP
ncbi:MAG TPA: hypothetical protein VFN03_13420, partial [Trueperaceae bacterium]|nr:hypothetical protein [Trueperaceae bacterium]